MKPSQNPRITKWWPHFDLSRDYKPKSAESHDFIDERDVEMESIALMKDDDDAEY